MTADEAMRDWWKASTGKAVPATVPCEPYARELYDKGLRPASGLVPEWANAEALGRQRYTRFKAGHGLPGMFPGDWPGNLASGTIGPVSQFTARLIMARGVAYDTGLMIALASYSWPDETKRMLAALPGAVAAHAPTIDADAVAALADQIKRKVGR